MSRILVFSPYASRPHLTAYEGTIARACRLRGAEIGYLLCDGLLPECDMHWDSFVRGNYPRPPDLCETCQSGARRQLADLGVPYEWLGAFVGKADRDEMFAWSQSVPPTAMRDASFRGDPLGQWVQSSVLSYFRQFPPDLGNWRVANAYRGFLYSGGIVAAGLRSYLDGHPVDAALLFNGRQSVTRVAFEVFRQRGIRVLTHETPFFLRGHLMVKPNARCWSLEPFAKFWAQWRDVSLTRQALEQTRKWLIDRRYARGLSWFAFNRPHHGDTPLREVLRLSPGRTLMALFTSSTDETAGDAELLGPYESQWAWVEGVVDWIGNRTDVDLVIRVHPHLAGNTGLGRADAEYDFFRRLRETAPPHVRVVMPDEPLNTYALMDEADIGLTFGSATGIEMALLGKRVVLASRAFYEDAAFALTVRSKSALKQALDASLEPVDRREIQREAFRLAYYNVFEFELPFPLVTAGDIFEARANYGGEAALAAGRDAALDRVCRYLMHGLDVFDPPARDDLNRSTDEEDAFLDALDAAGAAFRNARYDRWLPRLARIQTIGRRIGQGMRGLPLGDLAANVTRRLYRPVIKWLDRRV